jgi:hypothetical protein
MSQKAWVRTFSAGSKPNIGKPLRNVARHVERCDVMVYDDLAYNLPRQFLCMLRGNIDTDGRLMV